MGFQLEVHLGGDALELAKNFAFLSAWDDLEQKQQKFSVLQGQAFVYTWYRNYFPLYKPLLFLAKTPKGELVGVFPMAIHREKKYLTGAGDELAEYHGWLAHPEIEEDFVLRCLKILKSEFRRSKIFLTYLAPGTQISVLEQSALRDFGIYVKLDKVHNPLWNLEDPAKLKKITKRANVKRCFKQYAARGNFRLERILDKERMPQLIQQFGLQSDFKKEAIYNRKLFASDPYVEGFLTDLQDYPETNHFSVLWLDDKPLAFNHGVVDGKEMSLAGYTSYDPGESRNSPGKLHLIELARAAEVEGLALIDLTPGKDAYKTRFANAGREVVKPQLFFSKLDLQIHQWKSGNKEIFIDLLAKLKINERDLKYEYFNRLVYLSWLKRKGVGAWVGAMKSWVFEKKNYDAFLLGNKEAAVVLTDKSLSLRGYTIQKNDYRDLLGYEDKYGPVSRRAFLQTALTRFGRGDDLYTVMKGSQLIYLVWVRNGKYALTLPETNYEHQFPVESRVMYGLTQFDADISQEDELDFLDHIIQEVKTPEVPQLYVCLQNGKEKCKTLLNKYQAQHAFSHTYQRILSGFVNNEHQNFKVEVEPSPIPKARPQQGKRRKRQNRKTEVNP